jgi:hypothetical protein
MEILIHRTAKIRTNVQNKQVNNCIKRLLRTQVNRADTYTDT